MVSVLLIWVYLFITTFFCGAAFFCILSGKERSDTSLKLLQPEDHCFFGIMLSTVYAQIFSLFYKVGLAADILLLILTAAAVFFLIRSGRLKSSLFGFPSGRKKRLSAAALICFLVLIVSYGTSRGYFHYDSNLYHGQSIRWIEEFGVVKGLALLHVRLGYNSSSFALSALYSFSFLGIRSFHTVQGFLALLLLIKCLRVFHIFSDKEIRISDFARLGGFYYIFNVYDELVAPASDYFTMIAFIFCMIKALDIYEQCEKDKSLCSEESYVFPALLCVFIPTLKLSAAPAVILILVPVYMLIKNKKAQRLLFYAGLSLIISLPLFIRNYLLSGRLLYPSTALDLFDPAWKVPAGVTNLDAEFIAAFGKGYNYAEAAHYPFSQWFPHWLSTLGKSDLIIVIICLTSILILPLSIALRKAFKVLHMIELTAISAFLFWLIASPLVRYGMGFLLLLPPLMFGDLADILIKKSPKSRSVGSLIRRCFPVLLILFLSYKCFATVKYICSCLDAPYYLLQRDYDDFDCYTVDIDGLDVYMPLEGNQTGYYCFPGTPEMVEGLHLAGDDLKEGFILR